MSNTGVATAQLAIYAALSLPTIYVLIRHGKRGFLGWFYLFVFETLRIVGGAMLLKDPLSTGAIVISSIGISPLLLATLGILHEARSSRSPDLKRHIEVPFVVALHLLIASALGLIGAGAGALTSPNPQSSSQTLVKVGIVILLLSWLVIVGTGVVTLLPRKDGYQTDTPHTTKPREYTDGTTLLYAVLVSLVPTGIRVIYSVVAFFVDSSTLNPITGSLAIRVVLSVVPEMVAVIILLGAGLMTAVGDRKQTRV